ncbi:uncharacterized protein B0H18DRAFT_1112845 [Fomitopsis serialis]|uniref:uncharacterized protein n=1 Tax=Fomitopsis serialis TaxID=139415 RepID=UPI0020086312|nr:uncharacterized protein B0H18DRAFT_1112845 [Neoantrodia serialis]KAH9938722.1 hypothetical protein B0H18DRAFT_1112845 [Neoantrodia serialis]
MPKPTIIQALLGRPSQHYSLPQQKNYHYTKHELIRAATEDRHGSSSARRPVDLTVGLTGDTLDDDSEVYYTPSSSLAPSPQALTVVEAMLLEPQALATALLPIHGRPKLKSSIAPPTLSRDSSFDLDLDFAITPGPLSRNSSEDEPPPSAVVSRSSSDSSLHLLPLYLCLLLYLTKMCVNL